MQRVKSYRGNIFAAKRAHKMSYICIRELVSRATRIAWIRLSDCSTIFFVMKNDKEYELHKVFMFNRMARLKHSMISMSVHYGETFN